MKAVYLFLLFLPMAPQQRETLKKDWQQIVPLKSTRGDVERLLGPAKSGYGIFYELREGSLFIEYSSGPCKPERRGGWDVAENVVIRISFSPHEKRRMKHLKLDLKRFRKVTDDHVVGILYYVNDEDGITYEVQRGRVDSVEYGPKKNDEHFSCNNPPVQEPKRPGKN
jgi:hypothetical protein